MIPNNDMYTLKTAIVEADDKKKFLMEVAKVQNNMLNQGFEVTMQFQVGNYGIENYSTTYYMYIEGKKLNEKVQVKTV